MNKLSQPALLQSLVDLSAMVFGAIPPEDALQTFADALEVQTVAIGRIDHATGEALVLSQNAMATTISAEWTTQSQSSHSHLLVLGDAIEMRDVLIVQTRQYPLEAAQMDSVNAYHAYLQTLWASRTDSFDRALSMGRNPAAQNVLHPDNPYNLTPTEVRVCTLIAVGHRPATISHTMKTSMPTVRTHLRSIYTKTGLDGMMGVMRNLQLSANEQQAAG